MARARTNSKPYLGIGLVVVGALVSLIGIVGTIGAWGSKTTVVVAAPSAPTSTTTTAAPTTTSTLPPTETPEEFLTALGGAFAVGDVEYPMSRLHPEVLVRYSEEECRALFTNLDNPTVAFEIVAVAPPATYAWITDDQRADIANTLSIDVVRTMADGTQESATVHIVDDGGQFQFFSDCGSRR